MRTSAFVAAALAGVASAWPKFSGTASAIYPTGTGAHLGPGPVSINHHSSGGFFPSGSGAPTYTSKHHSSGGFFPSGSGTASYTGKHHSTGVYSRSQSGAGPTGTGHGGGSGGGHSTLPPTTITITGNVPTTTTKTVEITNTITSTISKPHISNRILLPQLMMFSDVRSLL